MKFTFKDNGTTWVNIRTGELNNVNIVVEKYCNLKKYTLEKLSVVFAYNCIHWLSMANLCAFVESIYTYTSVNVVQIKA